MSLGLAQSVYGDSEVDTFDRLTARMHPPASEDVATQAVSLEDPGTA